MAQGVCGELLLARVAGCVLFTPIKKRNAWKYVVTSLVGTQVNLSVICVMQLRPGTSPSEQFLGKVCQFSTKT